MATCAWITYSSSIPSWGPPTLLSNAKSKPFSGSCTSLLVGFPNCNSIPVEIWENLPRSYVIMSLNLIKKVKTQKDQIFLVGKFWSIHPTLLFYVYNYILLPTSKCTFYSKLIFILILTTTEKFALRWQGGPSNITYIWPCSMFYEQ